MVKIFFLIFFITPDERINKVLYLQPQKRTDPVVFRQFKLNDGEVAQLVRAHDS